jgi:hypothetical protein
LSSSPASVTFESQTPMALLKGSRPTMAAASDPPIPCRRQRSHAFRSDSAMRGHYNAKVAVVAIGVVRILYIAESKLYDDDL